MSILLIDGVNYEEWKPATEDEFERVVKEHARDIFGERSEYFDIKHKLKSRAGRGSIPDGFAIVFGDQARWHIVEIELSYHAYEHIAGQVSKFINGITNATTQKDIVDVLYNEINSDEFRKLRLRKAIGTTDTHKFLADLISEPAMLTIIIEKHTEEVDEALNMLAYSPQNKKVVEFQTFTREGVGLSVHAHLFEPVIKSVALVAPQLKASANLEHTLTPRELNKEFFYIPKRYKQFFPGPGIEFELQTDKGMVVKTKGHGTKALFIQKNLGNWFRAHRGELKPNTSKVVFEVIEPLNQEPMKRYGLRIA